MISGARIKRWIRRAQGMNGSIFCVVLALGLLGVVMQYSAAGGNAHVFAIPQAVRLLVGLALMTVVAIMPTPTLFRLSYLVYIACFGLLVVVLLVGIVGLGAQRWVGVGIFNLQPSELMKIGLILAMARYYHSATLEGTNHLFVLIVPLVLTLLPVGLILKQPNLGTATIVSIIAFAMCFMAGIRWYYFAGAIAAVGAAAPIGYHFLHGYQKQRVLTFLDPSADPLGAGYNIIQSKIAIGSGGFWGKGLLHGSQGQLDFLPEKQTDFIFTMLAEELGFVGVIGLMFLYAMLLAFAMMLATRCRNAYGRLIAAGVAAMFFAHILINTAMVMGMIPVVGVPLPFLSYGGSFLLTALIACGLLMHVYINRDTNLPRHRGLI